MLKIGDFSRLSRVSIRMLRHYDEIGLLRPATIDPMTGYRYYTEAQLRTATQIRSLREMGLGLTAIAEALCHGDDPALLARLLDEQEVALRARAAEVTHQLRLLDTARTRLRKDGTPMKYLVSLKTIPERQVASLRMTLPAYDAEGLAWSVLTEETAPLNLIPDDPCLCCVLYHDDGFKEHDVDVELQKTVRGHYADTAHVRFKREPAVTVASTVHNGSYPGLDDAMRAVADWICQNGYELSGTPFNIYHVSPHETQDASSFVTEICYPVRRREA